MKLTVLGRHGPYPAKGGSCSSYLLQDGKTNILIDCGSGALSNLPIGFDEISAVILSHLHFDHISDALVLSYALQIQNMIREIPKCRLYMPGEPAKTADLFKDIPYYDITEINDGMSIKIDDISITFAKMIHPALCFASKFKKGGKTLVYSGDTAINENLISFAKDADMLLIDCAILKKDHYKDSPHMSVFQAGEIAKLANVKKLIGTHLFELYSEDEILAELKQNYNGAVLACENQSYLI